MKVIKTEAISEAIEAMCIQANYCLSQDMEVAIRCSEEKEESPIGKQILKVLNDNLKVAKEEQVPICQDTGMAVVFVELGQEVKIEGGSIEEAIQEGVRRGYKKGFLRKSVVSDPLIRENTKDNTPAVIHYQIKTGDLLKLTVAPKGFGSENMSRLFMLKPSEGVEGVKKKVLETIDALGANACPPLVIGIGIGGTFEKVALLAKQALLRPIGSQSNIPHIRVLEEELIKEVNQLGVGPQGLGGVTTALGLHIETFPTHIAGLPLAINICCHVNRHLSRSL